MSEEEKSGLTTDPTLGPQFKSPPQGAATSVWAALSRSLEGMGGKYLEDVQIAKVYDASEGQWALGYFPHAYSPEKEKKLWDVSLKVGLCGRMMNIFRLFLSRRGEGCLEILVHRLCV